METLGKQSVEFYKKRSKRLFKSFKIGEPDAVRRCKVHIFNMENISLMKCQHVVARENGFSSWSDLLESING